MFFIKTFERQFKLSILGYEFSNPEMPEDLNWLNVKIYAKDADYEWSTNGPYLTTVDLQMLFSWLKNINDNTQQNKRLDFTEHELSFKLKTEMNLFIINLDFSFHPKGDLYEYDIDSEYELAFNIEELDMVQIMNSIEDLTKSFPVRFHNDCIN